MSGISGGGIGSYGVLGQLIADSAATRRSLDTLTDQAASGKISTSYAGLGSGVSASLVLESAVAHGTAVSTAISAASGPLSVTQTALSQISAIASSFYAQTDSLNGLNASDVDSVAAAARDALKQVAGLLDSKDGNVYVFAGQDSGNPPVPDPDDIGSSGFATQIGAAVAGLGTGSAGSIVAATLAIAGSNSTGTSPFSGALSQPATALAGLRSVVPTGPGTQITTGILASANASIASTGTSTTGSYTRDILRALATLGSLSSSQISTTGFAGVVADTRTSLGDSITALNADAGVLGDQQAQLTTTQTNLSDVGTALQGQVSDAEDVDMASTLSRLSQVQTQLQASYQMIADAQGLSLTKYLSATG